MDKFYRIDENGNARIFENDGSMTVRIDANVYPIGSETSARYEHADGIVLTVEDAKKIGIMSEQEIRQELEKLFYEKKLKQPEIIFDSNEINYPEFCKYLAENGLNYTQKQIRIVSNHEFERQCKYWNPRNHNVIPRSSWEWAEVCEKDDYVRIIVTCYEEQDDESEVNLNSISVARNEYCLGIRLNKNLIRGFYFKKTDNPEKDKETAKRIMQKVADAGWGNERFFGFNYLEVIEHGHTIKKLKSIDEISPSEENCIPWLVKNKSGKILFQIEAPDQHIAWSRAAEKAVLEYDYNPNDICVQTVKDYMIEKIEDALVSGFAGIMKKIICNDFKI